MVRGLVLIAAAALALPLIFAALGGFSSSAARADSGAASAEPATTRVVVGAGESLWAIAAKVDPAADPRELIARIVELNGLQGPNAATVRPGQSLIVPRIVG